MTHDQEVKNQPDKSNEKFPMPRPRILGPPRFKPRIMSRSPLEKTPREIPIVDLEEPDCEIIRIGGNEVEEIPANTSNVSKERTADFCVLKSTQQNPKQYGGPLQTATTPPIAPMFTLQYIQTPSSSTDADVFKGQNVVMIMPVNSGQPQTFNPTLCTIQRIENPAESFQVAEKSRSPITNDARAISEKCKNVQPPIKMRNSPGNRQPISCARDDKTNGKHLRKEIQVSSNHSSSVDEETLSVSIKNVESTENRSKSVTGLKKGKKRSSSAPTKLAVISEFPETENLEESICSSEKSAERSNKSVDQNASISASKRSMISCESEIIFDLRAKKRREVTFSKIQCIACKKNFTDRKELQRHTTLAHPDAQILFCERCSDSFSTHRELNVHRADLCKPKIAEKSKLLANSSRISEFAVPQTIEPVAPRKRGRPRKKIDSFKYKYVEEEVINYAIGVTKEALSNAEIKQLVVPLARLDERELGKYLKESTTRHNDKDGKSRRIIKRRNRPTEAERLKRDFRSMMGTKRPKSFSVSRKSANPRPKKPENSNKNKKRANSESESEKYANSDGFRSNVRPIDTESDENTDKSAIVDVTKIYRKEISTDEVKRVIGIKKDELPVIRKLTSRSSKASVLSLKTRKERESMVETHENLLSKKQQQDISPDREKSVAGIVKAEILEEFDPEEFREISKPSTKENVKERAENRQEKSSDSGLNMTEKPAISVARKTYLPSKRKAPIAPKSSNVTSYDLCLMCKELFTLMKQLACRFENNRAKRMSVKCPLCNMHFISMFYLKEHISNHHLHCRSQSVCKLARSSLIARSASANAAIDCETQVELALECQRCAMKFSEEEDLVDHVFAHHDLPIFDPESGVKAPAYLDDFPSYCFRSFRPESPLKIRRFEKNRLESAEKEATDFPDSANKSALSCSLCDSQFRSHVEYICHVKKSHDVQSKASVKSGSEDTDLTSIQTATSSVEIPLTPEITKIKGTVANCDLESIQTESSSVEIALTPEITKTDRTNANCDLLLKQLMSDDSQEVSESTRETEKLEETQKECRKSVESREINGQPEVTDLFADSPIASLTDAGQVDSAVPASSASGIGIAGTTCNPTGDDTDVTDNIFASEDENNDLYLISESAEANEIEDTDFGLEKSVQNARTIEDIESEKRRTLFELLEPEADLARPEASTKWPIECSKCDRKFPNQASLNEHLFFLHDDSLKDTVLTDVTSLQSPLGSPPEPKQWRCDRCSHTFKLWQTYSRHRYFFHRDDEFVHVCENCCKVLTTLTTVNMHICTDVASYNCRSCNKTFDTGMSLRLHNMDKHTETSGPHLCLPCNKKFLTNSMLKRHEKWKHRFLRPHRPRKSSPVRMATKTETDNEIDSGCDQEYVEMNHDSNGDSTPHRKRPIYNTELARKKKTRPEIGRQKRSGRSATFIEERDFLQCRLCRLYCLSKAALKAHEAQSHRKMGEFCRICERMHPKGKLLRHMIDRHIRPCVRNSGNRESIWNIEKSIEERDAEELVKMLGMKRLISMCEYHRFHEVTAEGALNCPNCDTQLESSEAYKKHFFEVHDVMCAICNIEFKSGDKAAEHKIEEHKSIFRYLWFVEKTIAALTKATNFSAVTEQSFIQMISRDSDEDSDQSDDDLLDAIEEAERLDQSSGFAANFSDMEDKKLIIVVTDEDLKEFQMDTEIPNIWGLASKISSTCEELTPSDVKETLSAYFER